MRLLSMYLHIYPSVYLSIYLCYLSMYLCIYACMYMHCMNVYMYVRTETPTKIEVKNPHEKGANYIKWFSMWDANMDCLPVMVSLSTTRSWATEINVARRHSPCFWAHYPKHVFVDTIYIINIYIYNVYTYHIYIYIYIHSMGSGHQRLRRSALLFLQPVFWSLPVQG